MAWRSRAARAEFAAASESRTCVGSTARAVAVDSCVCGVKTTGTTSGCGASRSVVVPSSASSDHDNVTPPWTLADELSGCPSSLAARSLTSPSSMSPGDLPSRAALRAWANAMPVTIAVAEEPMPRPWGTAFSHSRRRPAGAGSPQASKARTRLRKTRCEESVGTASAPSPDTVTSRPGLSRTVARQRSQTPRATPMESKPGPRLALLAGTRTAAVRPDCHSPTISSRGRGPRRRPGPRPTP